MKRILILSMIVLFTTVSWGRTWRTPFEKTERSETGKRMYQYENPQFSKSSLSVGYGYLPVQAMNFWTNPIFHSQNGGTSSMITLESKTKTNIGSIYVAYAHELTPWLELQVPISYTSSTGSFANAEEGHVDYNHYNEYYFAMTPNVKISWLFSDKFRFYSRIGLGFSIGNRYENFNAGLNSKFAFSWQISPVGIEVGKSVRFFAEAGFGTMGVIQAGIKFHFKSETNNSDGTPKAKSGEKFNWYERRLQ